MTITLLFITDHLHAYVCNACFRLHHKSSNDWRICYWRIPDLIWS